MTSLDVIRRYRLILRFWTQNITNPVAIQELLARRPHNIEVSLGTIRKDLREIEEWKGSLVRMDMDEEEIKAVMTDMIAKVIVAQDRMMQIMYSGDSSSAQVGAAKTLDSLVAKEAFLRTGWGQMEPPELKIRQEVTFDVNIAELVERGVKTISKGFMESEARRLREAEFRVIQSIDTPPA